MTKLSKDVLDAFQAIGNAIVQAIRLTEDRDDDFDLLAHHVTKSAASLVAASIVRSMEKGDDPAQVAEAADAAVMSCAHEFADWIREAVVDEVLANMESDGQTATPTSEAIN